MPGEAAVLRVRASVWFIGALNIVSGTARLLRYFASAVLTARRAGISNHAISCLPTLTIGCSIMRWDSQAAA